MKFKYFLNESSEYDLYPVITDVNKLGKEFQREGEIEWVNDAGQHFRSYHNGTLHRFQKYPYDLYEIMPDEDEFDEKLAKNQKKYILHFPEGLKEPKVWNS